MDDDKDGWWQSMLDLQTDICKRYAAEVAKLRKENGELRRQIATFPSDATAMQDRVTLLEGLCWRNPASNAAVPLEAAAEIDRLRAAIRQTIAENLDLADGEVCTLILLKRALGPNV